MHLQHTDESFASLSWHDAVLLEVAIDRRRPGEYDNVQFRVEWPRGGQSLVHFRQCYGLSVEMNFGIIANESILSANQTEEEPGVAAIRQRWAAIGIALPALRCFRIETSSTGSVLRVYALGFEVNDT